MRILVFATLTLAIFGWVCYRVLIGSRSLGADAEAARNDWIPAPDRNLAVYIGLPTTKPDRWLRVKSYDRGRLDLGDGKIVAPGEVTSYLLVYPNQEILTARNIFHPLPDGLKMLMGGKQPTETIALSTDEIARGREACEVKHEGVHRKADGRLAYATSLTNRLQIPIRILKFAGFNQEGDRYRLTTVSGDYYSAEQFASWYATKPDGWIQPGERVADESNYGGGKGVWAYFGETKDGRRFIAMAAIPSPS